MERHNRIILFDGVCNMCNSAVQFVIKKDDAGLFKFASLQSETGVKLLEKGGFNADELSSFVLIRDDIYYTKSTAALLVVKELNTLLKYLFFFRVIPPFIRDAIYDVVAKYRYVVFGKKESCMIPSASIKKRFLD